jgi:PhnB protein
MARLTPYIIVRDAARAIAFYESAFGARELFRLTEPRGTRIGHAEMTIGDSLLYVADEWPDFGALSPASVGGTPVTLHLAVDDADAAMQRAEAAGATVLRSVKDEFFGDRTGMVADPFGHKWQISAKKEEVSPGDMQQRWNAAMA